MEISLRKNKKLIISSMIFIVAFLTYLVFLLFPNIKEPESSTKLGLLPFSGIYFVLIFFEFESIVSLLIWIVISVLPLTLFIISLVYFIHNFVLLIKKSAQIKTSKLLFYQSCFLASVICFLILDLTAFKRTTCNDCGAYRVVYYYLSLYMLLPVLGMAIYHLLTTIFYILKKNKVENQNDVYNHKSIIKK